MIGCIRTEVCLVLFFNLSIFPFSLALPTFLIGTCEFFIAKSTRTAVHNLQCSAGLVDVQRFYVFFKSSIIHSDRHVIVYSFPTRTNP